MKVVYIAGPFRAASAWGIEQNVRHAEELAFDVAHMGAMPLCPHTNSRFFHGLLTDEFWIEGTLELLRRCDAVLVVPAYEGSRGTASEIQEAKRLGKPVFFERWALRDWLGAAK
jgi:nucleoside 2-deoxyribosyltransferase